MKFCESELDISSERLSFLYTHMGIAAFFRLFAWRLASLKKGPVAQWIRHLTSNQGIPGSSPGGVDVILVK